MKTALVLSGGGMFGAYQAGAWKALSREFAPDMVVGVSVGALNGWYIASGASADDLERHWLDPASGGLMAHRTPRLPWSIFDPRPLEMRAKFLVENYKPRVDFGVVLLQLPRLRPKLVRNSEITWRHLVATCSVPGGFPPVRIGGALYCDGGLLDAHADMGRGGDGRDAGDRRELLAIHSAPCSRDDDEGSLPVEQELRAAASRRRRGRDDHAEGLPGKNVGRRGLAAGEYPAMDRDGRGGRDRGSAQPIHPLRMNREHNRLPQRLKYIDLKQPISAREGSLTRSNSSRNAASFPGRGSNRTIT